MFNDDYLKSDLFGYNYKHLTWKSTLIPSQNENEVPKLVLHTADTHRKNEEYKKLRQEYLDVCLLKRHREIQMMYKSKRLEREIERFERLTCYYGNIFAGLNVQRFLEPKRNRVAERKYMEREFKSFVEKQRVDDPSIRSTLMTFVKATAPKLNPPPPPEEEKILYPPFVKRPEIPTPKATKRTKKESKKTKKRKPKPKPKPKAKPKIKKIYIRRVQTLRISGRITRRVTRQTWRRVKKNRK